jgi:DNA-binding MarR family transcriptional regulator
MDVQEESINEALAVLPELARALFSFKPRHHLHHHLMQGDERLPISPGCEQGAEPMDRSRAWAWRAPQDIPDAQIKLVMYLAIHGSQTMSDLAEGLKVTTPAITGLVDKLEKRGMVERLRDPQDRRVVHVRLAPRARLIAEQHLEARRRQMRLVLTTLTPEEQRMFIRTLKLLAQTFSPWRDEPLESTPFSPQWSQTGQALSSGQDEQPER